jgi:exopolysaccharide biosynthesis polyprenyl glycosylphosphotransferase
LPPSPAAAALGGDGTTEIASSSLDGIAAAPPRLQDAALPHRHVRRGWLVRRMLLGADVLGLLAAFFLCELLFRGNRLTGGVGIGAETGIFLAALPAWIFLAKLYGLYDRDEERTTHSTADEVISVFHLITVGAWSFFAISWLVGLGHPSQSKLTVFWLVALVSVITARSAARTIARRQASYVQNALILGAGDIGQLIGRKLVQHSEYRINLVGFVDDDPRAGRTDLDLQLLGAPSELSELIRTHEIDRVIVAFSNDHHERTLELVRALRKHDVQIDMVPRLFEAVSPNMDLHSVEGFPLLGLPPARILRSSLLLKRSFDVVGAALLLVLTAPVMILIAALVRRDSPGPAFFRQTRLGMDMREFSLFKFRTMREGTDDAPHREYLRRIMDAQAVPGANNLYKLERAEDTTRIGRWLRKTSLDELPQLINVLRGDMSLVGPRPSIPYELELFAPQHFERFLVPAGLTGLWQVEARAHSTFAEALDLDVAYARGWSLGLDMRLLLRTPLLVLRKKDTV